ncbi:hypothetical protein Q1695_016313 [Nippostrongylus brasiliensis]|nr:hypothetical protein Q1695_016313 [Nippostrongylus brasiliensis]
MILWLSVSCASSEHHCTFGYERSSLRIDITYDNYAKSKEAAFTAKKASTFGYERSSLRIDITYDNYAKSNEAGSAKDSPC